MWWLTEKNIFSDVDKNSFLVKVAVGSCRGLDMHQFIHVLQEHAVKKNQTLNSGGLQPFCMYCDEKRSFSVCLALLGEAPAHSFCADVSATGGLE